MTFSTVSLAGLRHPPGVLSSAVTGAVQRPLSAMYSGAAAGGPKVYFAPNSRDDVLVLDTRYLVAMRAAGATAGGAFPVLRSISTRGIGYSQPQPSPTTPTPAAPG